MVSSSPTSRLWKRYRFYFTVAIIILLVQFFLALSFYGGSQSQDEEYNQKTPHQTIRTHDETNRRFSKKHSLKSNQSPNAKNGSNLRLKELDFTPPCLITQKEIISAINRATTKTCQMEIANISCHLDKDFYPTNLPRTCPHEGIIKQEARGYQMKPSRKRIKIAFIFSLTGRAVRQVRRLIRVLYSPKHFYYIHVDSRQEFMFNELLPLEKAPNIRLSRNRLATIWGGASLLTMLLNSITDLISLAQWDYVINLSESAFPLKSLTELEAFLSANRDFNFVKSHGQENKKFIVKQGLDKTFYECDEHMWRLGDRSLPNGVIFDGGSDWIGLSRDFCEYLAFEKNELLTGLQKIFAHTLLPAESYFHTVLQNTHFCDYVVDNNLHLTNWHRKLGCKCQYKHIVDWCGCSPNDYKAEDWPKLEAAKEKLYFFARKFEPVVSNEIINVLEKTVISRPQETKSLDQYWQNEYHSASFSPVSDGQLTFFHAVGMLAKMRVASLCHGSQDSTTTQDSSDFSAIMQNPVIHQAHLYFENDQFKGWLIMFGDSKANQINASYTEVFVRPITYSTVHQKKGVAQKLISLTVCSDYDSKEQIFRNFGCILHPYSNISVQHKWLNSEDAFSVTFAWLDPSYVVAGSFEMKIKAGDQQRNTPLVLHHKPPFKHPLSPGTWRLLILSKGNLIVKSSFLVLPYLYYNGKLIEGKSVRTLHGGPKQMKYMEQSFPSLDTRLRLTAKRSSRSSVQLRNAHKYGHKLVKWVHGLIQEFWAFQDICVETPQSLPCSIAHLGICKDTHWSSLYPDPKSVVPL